MTILKFPIIETQRLLLNKLTVEDRDTIFAIFSDPKTVEHYDVERFKSVEEADQLMAYFDARFASNTGIRWAIRDKSSGKCIGTCGYTNWNEFDHSAVVGYELSKEYWGKGFATEAVASILDFIFADNFHFYVHRVEALILPTNKPSQQLVKRLGFHFEGKLRGKCYWNNDFHDMDMFGILRHEHRKENF
ncbi:MAG: GNAT family N-acetyltransferase [Paraglaciecola sp.]|uniref:GNAT family N-acetyltransferase n=1 Tax=Paraglaciecola sp. TaxID=1920173 RepID=UPI003297CDEF